MSHFTVLVIGDNPEEQLAPYQENNMDDCPEEYLEFHDEETEEFEKYQNESQTKVLLPNGQKVFPWKDEAKELKKNSPELYVEVETPYKEMYSTFEEYMKEYCGRSERDEKTGKYGYWENPNRKWDWYSLGGRWMGNFKLKVGAKGIVGRPGVFGNDCPKGYVDQALMGDIDWEGMKVDAEPEAEKARRFWELFIEKQEAVTDDDKEMIKWPFYKEQYYIDKYKTKENYAQSMLDFHTWAVLKNGEWSEPGKMGWWGCSSASSSEESDWQTGFFDKWIKDLPEDTLLSVYDCHI